MARATQYPDVEQDTLAWALTFTTAHLSVVLDLRLQHRADLALAREAAGR
jgi:hypothetical protein